MLPTRRTPRLSARYLGHRNSGKRAFSTLPSQRHRRRLCPSLRRTAAYKPAGTAANTRRIVMDTQHRVAPSTALRRSTQVRAGRGIPKGILKATTPSKGHTLSSNQAIPSAPATLSRRGTRSLRAIPSSRDMPSNKPAFHGVRFLPRLQASSSRNTVTPASADNPDRSIIRRGGHRTKLLRHPRRGLAHRTRSKRRPRAS
mmetsp:Transcript_24676/g.69095  ORF Transcript_24676/g.69095 Transcript_24676/m.69095 type:complete len:200 (+) Transcript_24676:1567-2166(+)